MVLMRVEEVPGKGGLQKMLILKTALMVWAKVMRASPRCASFCLSDMFRYGMKPDRRHGSFVESVALLCMLNQDVLPSHISGCCKKFGQRHG